MIKWTVYGEAMLLRYRNKYQDHVYKLCITNHRRRLTDAVTVRMSQTQSHLY